MALPDNFLDEFVSKPTGVDTYDQIFDEAAKEYGVSKSLLKAIARQESNGRANVVSDAGATGIMQLMPETSRRLGVSDPYDPRENIMGGAKLVRQLMDEFGDEDKVIAGYKAGAGAVRKAGGIPQVGQVGGFDKYVSENTSDYVQKVLGHRSQFQEPLSDNFLDEFATEEPFVPPETPLVYAPEPEKSAQQIQPGVVKISPDVGRLIPGQAEAAQAPSEVSPPGVVSAHAKSAGKALVGAARILASKVPSTVIGIAALPWKVLGAVDGAVEAISYGGSPSDVVDQFKAGWEGERGGVGEVAAKGEAGAQRLEDIIKGELTTESERYNDFLVDSAISAYFITMMGRAAGKKIPRLEASAKNYLAKYKELKTIKLNEGELANVWHAHKQYKVGDPLLNAKGQPLTPRETAFFETALKESGQVRANMIKSGVGGEQYGYLWQKKGFAKVPKTTKPVTPEEIRLLGGPKEPVKPAEPKLLTGRRAGVERRVTQKTLVTPEKRVGPRRKKIGDLSQAEAQKELATDELTGLLSKRGWKEARDPEIPDIPTKKHVAAMDMDALKWVNDNLGHGSGDVLLKSMADALKDAGVEDAARPTGDEFFGQSDNPEKLELSIQKAQDILKKKTINVTLPDGSTVTYKGAGFSYGIAESEELADAGLRKSKAEREAAGVRPARGAEPKGVVKTPPQGQQDNLSKVVETLPDIGKPTTREPALDVSQAGRVAVLSQQDIRRVYAKAASIFSVEAPYRAMGAFKTGRAVKDYVSRTAANEERGIKSIKTLNTKGIRTMDDDSDVILTAANSKYAETLSPERKAKLKDATDYYTNTVENYAKLLKEKEVLHDPWPQSAIRRLNIETEGLRGTKPMTKDVRAKINANLEDIAALKSLKYTHLPMRAWLENKFEGNPGEFRAIISASFKGIKGRKTVDPYDLVERGVIKKDQFSARESLALYQRYVENQLAQAEIRDFGIQEGVVKSVETAPEDWVELDDKLFPAFKGKRMEPMLADMMTDQFLNLYPQRISGIRGRKRALNLFDTAMTVSKAATFNNPLYVPLNDIWQAAGFTQFRSLKNLKRGWVDVVKKTPQYFEAADAGAFSTPVPNPFATFKANVEKAMSGQGLKGAIIAEAKRLKENPLRIFSDIYTASFNINWGLDKVVRMSTYDWLKKKGYSPVDAGKLTAEIHGDYAGVPAATRKKLNRVLYTPTYQIAMVKFQLKNLASVYKAPKATINRVFKGKKVGTEEKEAWARLISLGTQYGMLSARGALLGMLGWKAVEWGRKYRKEITYTDENGKEQKKDANIVFADPYNVPMRYYYRFVKKKPGMTKVEQVAKSGRYLLHPAWKLTWDIIDNRKPSGDKIFNEFDPISTVVDPVRYAAGETFRMYGSFIKEDDDTKSEAINTLRKATENPLDVLVASISFPYISSPIEMRYRRQVNSLYREFYNTLKRKPPKNTEQLNRTYKSFLKQLDKIEAEMEDPETLDRLYRAREKGANDFFLFDSMLSDGPLTKQELEEFDLYR